MNYHLPLSLALLAIGMTSTAGESISDELAKLKGQPIANVTARLGNPESQQPSLVGATFFGPIPFG